MAIDIVHDQFADVVYVPGIVGNHSLQLAIDVSSDMTVLLSTNTTCPEENGGYCPFPIDYDPHPRDTLLVGQSLIPFAIANTTTHTTSRFSPAELASELKQLLKVTNDTYAITNRLIIVAPLLEGFEEFPEEITINDDKYSNVTLDYTVSGIGIDGDAKLKCGDVIKLGQTQVTVPAYGNCNVKRFNHSEGVVLGWDALASLDVVFQGHQPKYFKVSDGNDDKLAGTGTGAGTKANQTSTLTAAVGDGGIVTQSRPGPSAPATDGAKPTDNAATRLSAGVLLVAAMLL